MRDKIGRHKDQDRYLSVSLDIVDEIDQIVLRNPVPCPLSKNWLVTRVDGPGLRADPRPVQGLGSVRSLTVIPDKPVYIGPAILKWSSQMSSVMLCQAFQCRWKINSVSKKKGRLGCCCQPGNGRDPAEMPMSASRQKKEGGRTLRGSTRWTMKNWPTNLIKRLWAYASRMELPKDPQE